MVIVCADDFGQNSEISQGILQLVEKKRLNAVSCMVTEPACQTYAQALLVHQSQLELGLHLNLTHGKSSLFKVIAQSYRLWPCSRKKLKKELQIQIETFYRLFAQWPDFIDGHQHVHQFPKIADVLLEVLKELKIAPWLRGTYDWKHIDTFELKKLALCVLGGNRFVKKMKQEGFALNSQFAGEYSFRSDLNYRQVFIKALKQIQGEGLIMCHPGLSSKDLSDPIRQIRPIELAYFLSEDYLEDLKFNP